MDSDDIWYFNKLSRLKKLTDDNFDIICSNEYRHDLNEGIRKPLYYNLKSNNFYQELLSKGNQLSTSATIVSRDFLSKNELGFSENLDFITVEDYDFWMQIALKNGSFGFCKEFLGEFRIHGRNNSNNFISPTFESLTTSFSLNVEYEFLIKEDNSSLDIKSDENRFIISVDNSL